MSVYKVTGNWAGNSLPWTRPDRRAYINGCDDEGHDGVQTSVWSGWMACIRSKRVPF